MYIGMMQCVSEKHVCPHRKTDCRKTAGARKGDVPVTTLVNISGFKTHIFFRVTTLFLYYAYYTSVLLPLFGLILWSASCTSQKPCKCMTVAFKFALKQSFRISVNTNMKGSNWLLEKHKYSACSITWLHLLWGMSCAQLVRTGLGWPFCILNSLLKSHGTAGHKMCGHVSPLEMAQAPSKWEGQYMEGCKHHKSFWQKYNTVPGNCH